MSHGNMENAYAYEIERRKDEMREAAHSQLVRQVVHKRKSRAWSITILAILAWLFLTFLG